MFIHDSKRGPWWLWDNRCQYQKVLIKALIQHMLLQCNRGYVKCSTPMAFIYIYILWMMICIQCVTLHYNDVIMSAIASLITSFTIVYSTVYSDADQKKLRVTGLCVGKSPGPVNSPHKWPVTRKMFRFDDVIMKFSILFFRYDASPGRQQAWYCLCRINGSSLTSIRKNLCHLIVKNGHQLQLYIYI